MALRAVRQQHDGSLLTRPPRSLRETMAAARASKRRRLAEASFETRKGPGAKRTFKALEFPSDRAAFDARGGSLARQEIVTRERQELMGKRRTQRELYAPEVFTYSDNLEGVLRFVYELRRSMFIDRHFTVKSGLPPFYVNFDLIRVLDLEGALILTAELDRIRRVIGFSPRLDDHAWYPEIRAMLHGLGLHDVIGANRRFIDVPIDHQGYLRTFRDAGYQIIKMRSGVGSSNELAREMRDELFEACRPFSQARPQFYNVLVEAFNNSREHAYQDGIGDDGIPSVRGWWAGALISHSQGIFTLAVYDQGIGIPERFSRQHEELRLQRELPEGDVRLLRFAVSHGATSTSAAGRGNGLWQMTELTRDIPGSTVEFMSLNAGIGYRGGQEAYAWAPPHRFGGTLVRWQIPFR